MIAAMPTMRFVTAFCLALISAGPVGAQTTAPSPEPSAAATAGPAAVFEPPAGWKSREATFSMGGAHLVSLWISPSVSDTGASMNLVAEDLQGHTQAEYIASLPAQLALLSGAKNVKTVRPQKLCNGTFDGWYGESNFTFGSRDFVGEQAIAFGSSQVFILTYTRRAQTPEDPAAHSALLSLCLPS